MIWPSFTPCSSSSRTSNCQHSILISSKLIHWVQAHTDHYSTNSSTNNQSDGCNLLSVSNKGLLKKCTSSKSWQVKRNTFLNLWPSTMIYCISSSASICTNDLDPSFYWRPCIREMSSIWICSFDPYLSSDYWSQYSTMVVVMSGLPTGVSCPFHTPGQCGDRSFTVQGNCDCSLPVQRTWVWNNLTAKCHDPEIWL